MGRKASYRRNNVKEAVNDETAVKNVETVKEKVEAVKDKAEAVVEAVKENVKASAVGSGQRQRFCFRAGRNFLRNGLKICADT